MGLASGRKRTFGLELLESLLSLTIYYFQSQLLLILGCDKTKAIAMAGSLVCERDRFNHVRNEIAGKIVMTAHHKPHRKEFQQAVFRVIYPFLIKDNVGKLCENVSHLLFGAVPVWHQASELPDHYHDNHISFVRERFLKENGGSTRYFSMSEEAQSLIPSHLDISANVPLKLGNPFSRGSAGDIEMFVSDYGAGLLSICFSVDLPEIDTVTCLELLSRIHLGAAWEERAAILSPPVPQPSLEQIGLPADKFHLHQLVGKLLPTAWGIRSPQRSFNIFFAGRLKGSNDFGSHHERRKIVPLIANLQNLWRSEHAGIADETMLQNHRVFNKRHWTAVSRTCAAHVLSDQAPNEGMLATEFNSRRLERVMAKFYFPYVLAKLQHLTLQQTTNQALTWAQCARSACGLQVHDESDLTVNSELAKRSLRVLRDKVSHMSLSLMLDEVSSEDNPQNFYHLCLNSLGVPDSIAPCINRLMCSTVNIPLNVWQMWVRLVPTVSIASFTFKRTWNGSKRSLLASMPSRWHTFWVEPLG